jgi:hypothetical protein
VGLTLPQYSAYGDEAGYIWIWSGCHRNPKPLGRHTADETFSNNNVSEASDGSSSVGSYITVLTPHSSMKQGLGGGVFHGLLSGSREVIKLWDVASLVLLREFKIYDILSQVNRSVFVNPRMPSTGAEEEQKDATIRSLLTRFDR